MNNIKRKQKVATLSNVLIMTTTCRLNVGMKRNTLSRRNSRNVLKTEMPELSELVNSNKLTPTIKLSNKFSGSFM